MAVDALFGAPIIASISVSCPNDAAADALCHAEVYRVRLPTSEAQAEADALGVTLSPVRLPVLQVTLPRAALDALLATVNP